MVCPFSSPELCGRRREQNSQRRQTNTCKIVQLLRSRILSGHGDGTVRCTDFSGSVGTTGSTASRRFGG